MLDGASSAGMASFHRVALGLLLAVVVVGCLAALFPPSCTLQRRGVPEASPAVQQQSPAAMAPAAPRTVDLDAVAAGAVVPRPAGWPPFGDPTDAEDDQGTAFVARMLPLVLMVEEEVLASRARLWAIRQEINGGGELRPEDRLWLSDAFARYRVEKADMAALIRRIDAVPPSILIAASAIATGWNAANEAGWRAMAAAARVAAAAPVAESAPPAAAPPVEALRLYLWTINSHPDFAPFRRARERARLESIPLAGAPLAVTLPRVAPGRLPGAVALADVIADHQLGRFDAVRLAAAGADAAR